MANREIREAAESLLGSFSNYHTQPSCSHNQYNLISDDWWVGHQIEGRMSTVRRFFCLFVTFDLLFTSLLWLICLMIRGESLANIVASEVIHYNIKSSLFDIVVVALCRFVLLEIFYGMLHINNWSVIALCTGGTCSFMLTKVFLFDWPNANDPVYVVFLIVATFIIAWGEAWFLDFRVLPQETQAKRIFSSLSPHAHGNLASERTPLLRPSGPGSQLESVSHFFSPVETPESSPRPRPGNVIITQELIEEYQDNATNSVRTAWRVLNQPGWKVEKRIANGDVVESLVAKEYGKVFKFTGVVDCPPAFLFSQVSDDLTRLPEWNPTILETHYIKKINSQVDLSYQVTAGGGNGIIAPRDFVTLRRSCGLTVDGELIDEGSDEVPEYYITAGTSVECPGYPPNKNYVRGENRVGCWCVKPHSSQSGGKVDGKAVFHWMLSCNLKGRIPQFVIDTAFSTVMLDYVGFVRKHIKDCKDKNMF